MVTAKTTYMTKTNQKASKAQNSITLKVSTPAEALALFKSFVKNATSYHTIPGSKSKWYTISQVIEYYAANQTQINAGWFGRALNAAINSGSAVSVRTAKTMNGESLTLYRSGK